MGLLTNVIKTLCPIQLKKALISNPKTCTQPKNKQFAYGMVGVPDIKMQRNKAKAANKKQIFPF